MADQVAAPADPVPIDLRHRLTNGTLSAGASPSLTSRHRPAAVVTLGTTVTTTYYYRTSGGAYGSTASVGAIPGGATVLGRVTT